MFEMLNFCGLAADRQQASDSIMNDLAALIAYLLASMGLTVLIVWPKSGPTAWIRERVLRRLLPTPASGALDCYVCASFWCGFILGPIWWSFEHHYWYFGGCLMVPSLFWLSTREQS
jgi:hypothetical protein